jgi:colanic acid/amylovoran biosynthesis protein
MKQKTFILAGNGPYDNLGCEAIVRGTKTILKKHFGNTFHVIVSHFRNETQFQKQLNKEKDISCLHKKTYWNINQGNDFFSKWFMAGSKLASGKRHRDYVYSEMIPYIDDSTAVLSIGGDNYSLDYGIPLLFTQLDNFVLERKKPLIIWGASVGPFNKYIIYENYIIKHLKRVNGIFARESTTIKYLKEKGLDNNIFSVADPAFLMNPTMPGLEKGDLAIEPGSIGINLSPLMARYCTNGNMEEWIDLASNIVSLIIDKLSLHVYLIPHVLSPHSNDYLFLRAIEDNLIKRGKKVSLIPPIYDAAETKWIISGMSLFIGARTHSTIASISSCVPTLSLAYSMKAQGINRDVFDSLDYCINPYQLTPDIVAMKLQSMLQKSDEIKYYLNKKLPKIQEIAMGAGKYLQNILEE